MWQCVYGVYVCMGVSSHAMLHTWRSGDNLQELVLVFHLEWAPGTGFKSLGFRGKCFAREAMLQPLCNLRLSFVHT